MLEAEKKLAAKAGLSYSNLRLRPRRIAQFYSGGPHGSCKELRAALAADHACTESGKLMQKQNNLHYSFVMRQTTFCPCPGGDSPSAKRMFDALHGGCIPVILSHDFVWPYSDEFDTVSAGRNNSLLLDASEFSIRVNASHYTTARHDESCNRTEDAQHDSGLQSLLESIPPEEIQRLREGVARASDAYAYYKRRDTLPENPLRERVLPDGGAAQALVGALAERQRGALYPACQKEKSKKRYSDPQAMLTRRYRGPRQFLC
jgi:hypothetical protein